MSWLTKALGFQATTNNRIADSSEAARKVAELAEKGVEHIRTATEFLVTVADRLTTAPSNGSRSLYDAVEFAVPWIESAAEVVGDALPPVKAALKMLELLTKENDPRALGFLAFSLAYQSAVADSVKAIEADVNVSKKGIMKVDKSLLNPSLKTSKDSLQDFDKFRLENCISHPLM